MVFGEMGKVMEISWFVEVVSMLGTCAAFLLSGFDIQRWQTFLSTSVTTFHNSISFTQLPQINFIDTCNGEQSACL